MWNLNSQPEFWTSITASSSAGEGNWLNCQFAPATAPNTGMYFQPELKVDCLVANEAATGTVEFVYEVEAVIEFRGSLK